MDSNISKDDTLSVTADGKEFKSGQTSPEEARSVFSARPRSNTESTLVSSIAEGSHSVSTATQPDVPVNSPMNGSIAGDAGVDAAAAIARIETITPKTSFDGIMQAGKSDGKGDLKEATKREGVTESTVWESEAIEWAGTGLRRLIQLAKDEHVVDSSKSVEQYYSAHLAKVIKEAEVEFDAMKLQ